MSTICLNFQAHQPYRLGSYDFFKIGEHAYYENDELNARVLNSVSERSYLHANRLMKQLIELTDYKFKFSLALSGILLEQCFKLRPDVITSFSELVQTGCVELLAMPYYMSLASVYSPDDFMMGVKKHGDLCQQLFSQRPKTLWNTALAYSDGIARMAADMGLEGIFADSVDYVLQGRNCNELYHAPGLHDCKTFFRHGGFSHDLAVRRVDPSWNEYPLHPGTFASWLSRPQGSIINICLNYELLGDQQDESTGVFPFWRELIGNLLDKGNNFVTPREAVATIPTAGECPCPDIITTGTYHTTHDWLSNVLQNEAITKIYHVEASVKACGDPDLLDTWRKLQTADHFLYMSTDGSPFSPFSTPYDMYISYMNALADLQVRVGRLCEISAAQKKTGYA